MRDPGDRRGIDTVEATLLLRRLRLWTGFIIAGLVLSGLTAIPIRTQFDLDARWFGTDFTAGGHMPAFVAQWLATAHRGVLAADGAAPFIWYGTDWLAFGHVVIAIAFVGAWRDPVRNRWLYQFALIAGALVIPWALVFGALRGIPLWWRAIDSLFGLGAMAPAWACLRWVAELERQPLTASSAAPGRPT